jgi:hypothetical protein
MSDVSLDVVGRWFLVAYHHEQAADLGACPFFKKREADVTRVWANRRVGMEQRRQRINMYDRAVFCIRIEGKLSESWSEYFGAQSMSVEVDEAGLSSTTLISEPVDQAALIGMINHLNGLGLPLVSVECLPTAVENEPLGQGDA